MDTLNETQVNELRTKKLYTITEEPHKNFIYYDGLNTRSLVLDDSGVVKGGGFPFFPVDNVFMYASCGIYIREVTIPEGEPVYKELGVGFFMCQNLILGKRKKLFSKSIIKKLLREGAQVFPRCKEIVQWAALNGHSDIVKTILEQSSDVSDNYFAAIQYAVEKGHLDALKRYPYMEVDIADLIIPKHLQKH